MTMSTYSYAVMLAPGTTEEFRRFATELTVTRKEEHEDYLRRYHLVKEYGWIQGTPMGDMFTIYYEATDDFLAENRMFAASTQPFDVWFKQRAGQLLGQDLNTPLPPDFVEVLYETHDVAATGREKPLALASQVLPGKTDALRQLIADLTGPRKAEFQDAHRRFGAVKQNVYLEHTPQGDLTVYYEESADPVANLQKFGQSQDPFDVWWKERLLDVTGIDYSQPFPGPLPELILSTTMPAVGAAR
jgi:hypothetical protein